MFQKIIENKVPIIAVSATILFLTPLFMLVNKQFDRTLIHQENVGNLINAQVVPTSFNENQKMRIETTKGIYIVNGLGSFTKNQEIIISYWSNGNIWLWQIGQDGHYKLIK